MKNAVISEEEREALYKVIYSRRDVRSQFLPKPIPSDVLARILQAAHHAGSVGFMQPWNFIVVEDRKIRGKVLESFQKERKDAAKEFDPKKREKYLSYKLEGILDAPVNLLVTCDPERMGRQVLGRHSMPETDVYSTVCAIQNLWLAARAENIGMGWVSILKPKELYSIFDLPQHLIVVAYLCLGYVSHFEDQPDLEKLNWARRLSLEGLVYHNQWNQKPADDREDLCGLLNKGGANHAST